MRHTPGPWRVLWRDSVSQSIIVGPDDTGDYKNMITVEGPNRGPNSLLIAVGPELLEVLERIVQIDNERCCPHCTKDEWGEDKHDEDCVFAKAYAAIAKAKGE